MILVTKQIEAYILNWVKQTNSQKKQQSSDKRKWVGYYFFHRYKYL